MVQRAFVPPSRRLRWLVVTGLLASLVGRRADRRRSVHGQASRDPP